MRSSNALVCLPKHQVMFWLLIAHMCLLPLVMISFTKSPALASLVSFLAVEMFFALELVARELENSFGDDANDFDFESYQSAALQSQRRLLHWLGC